MLPNRTRVGSIGDVPPGTTPFALRLAVPAGTPVLSLQNGMQNAPLASQAAPALNVVPGMVAFNVAHGPDGRFHRGTAGQLAARDTPALRLWQPHFERAGLPLVLHTELRNVQWGKLLLNLNNPAKPELLQSITMASLWAEAGAANSVAVHQGMVALAVPPGRVGGLRLRCPGGSLNWRTACSCGCSNAVRAGWY